MNGVFEAAHEAGEFLRSKRWKYCIIGGLAVQHWGEPRTTLYADITLECPWGNEEQYVKALLSHFQARIEDAEQFAMANRVVLIRASNGKDVDISLGALPFEESMIRRAEVFELAPGLSLPFCTAEDLIVMKAFASRPRDWADVHP